MGTKCNPLVGIKEDARVGIKRTPRVGIEGTPRVGTKRWREVWSREIEKCTPSPSFTHRSFLTPYLLAVMDEEEAEVMKKGGEEAIMLRHHLKTLDE